MRDDGPVTVAERLAEAEETIIQLRKAIAPERMPVYDGLRLTRSEAIILKALVDYSDWVSTERLAARLSLTSELGTMNDWKSVNVHMCRMRPKLKAVGVTIETNRLLGHFIGKSGKERLSMLRKLPLDMVKRLDAA